MKPQATKSSHYNLHQAMDFWPEILLFDWMQRIVPGATLNEFLK